MKNKVILLISFVLLAGNAAFSQTETSGNRQRLTKEQKKGIKRQQMISLVADAIEKDNLVIEIDKIRPSFAANRDKISYQGYTGNTLKLQNNKVSVNFIYIGEAPTAMMGTENIYICAKEQSVEPVKSKNQKNGNTNYYFSFTNEYYYNNPQIWECFIEIQPNGESVITMQTIRMNPMIYQGYLDFEKQQIKKDKR